MTYLLENESEAARLEQQSQSELFDFRRELAGLKISENAKILDAGCGSGIVSRYLAGLAPSGGVVGVDFSETRVRQAKNLAKGISNIEFIQGDLCSLPVAPNTFDLAVCRYVAEHFSSTGVLQAFKSLHNSLKIDGEVCVVDIDGYLFNLFPLTPLLEESFEKVKSIASLDLNVGRKIPSLLESVGFKDINWKIQTLEIRGDQKHAEIEMILARLQQVYDVLSNLFGSKEIVDRFIDEYITTLKKSSSVLFYNMFIVTARKRKELKIVG